MMAPRTRSKQAWGRLPILFGVALVIGACSSSSGGGSSTATTAKPAGSVAPTSTTVDSAAALGTKKVASGQTLTIGYVYDGVSAAADYSHELTAAQASVQYVNDYLGGVAGRPIKLDVCSTGSTPAGAADCVTKMVTDKVPVVLNGVTEVPGNLFPALSAAGIPSFSTGALDQKSLSAADVYLMGNPLLTVLAGPAQVAANANVTQAAIVVVDNPAASAQLKQAAPLFYNNVHVKVDVVTIPVDEPDVSPQITAELAKSPGLVQVVGEAPFCAKVMRALDSAGYHGIIVPIPNCITAGSNAAVPNMKGSILLGLDSTDPSSPEVKLYNAVLATYGPAGLDRGDAITEEGYQVVVGFARAIAGLQGDVTSATINATLAAMPATPFPLADGVTFQCNHKAVAIAPNICSSSALQTTLDAQGKGTTFSVLDGSKVLKLG